MNLPDIQEELFFAFRHPRMKISIASFVIFAMLVLAVWATHWLPIRQATARLETGIGERRAEILNASRRDKLARASSIAAQQIAMVEQKLDASSTQAVRVKSIAALARRCKVKIISEGYEEGRQDNGYLPLIHELTVQAGYAELREFIFGVQQLPIFAIVQEAVLTRTAGSSAIKAQLNIITYRRAVEPQT